MISWQFSGFSILTGYAMNHALSEQSLFLKGIIRTQMLDCQMIERSRFKAKNHPLKKSEEK